MVVDSSVWVEILSSGPLGARCQDLVARASVSIPILVLFEVYRKIKLRVNDEAALEVVAGLGRHQTLELTRDVALLAADLSVEHGLPMADSIVLAHARSLGEELLTLDNDFAGLRGVKVIRK